MALEQLLTNPIFWSIVIAGGVSQLLKILIIVIKHEQPFHPADLLVTGGMPSTHTALVVALVVIEYLISGFSNLFFVTFVFAIIIIRDSLGVRRTAGEEGQVLNEIIKKSKLKLPQLHYSLGHTPAQVLVGAVIGLLAAVTSYVFFV